jgi:hypothetical protein
VTKILFQIVVTRTELPALMAVVALLMAGMLTKLGHGWWGIALMVALCVLDIVRRPKPATSMPVAGHAPAPMLGWALG